MLFAPNRSETWPGMALLARESARKVHAKSSWPWCGLDAVVLDSFGMVLCRSFSSDRRHRTLMLDSAGMLLCHSFIVLGFAGLVKTAVMVCTVAKEKSLKESFK